MRKDIKSFVPHLCSDRVERDPNPAFGSFWTEAPLARAETSQTSEGRGPRSEAGAYFPSTTMPSSIHVSTHSFCIPYFKKILMIIIIINYLIKTNHFHLLYINSSPNYQLAFIRCLDTVLILAAFFVNASCSLQYPPVKSW